ncbi:MAG: hypothetical protein SNG27_09960 [Rikenellaceae bacterium]
MPRPKQKLTSRHHEMRKAIVQELRDIEPVTPKARYLLSTEGFIDYYFRMRELYDTYLDAYEALEEYYTSITGHRRYSDYDSLRRAILRRYS